MATHTPPFGDTYSSNYDLFYRTKDYSAEVALIQQILEASGMEERRMRILDLGCGTGGHALLLAKLGYDVVGVDRSAAMLEQAQRKAGNERISVTWMQASSTDFELPQPVQVVICMFAVFGYHHSDEEVSTALKHISKALDDDGLFIMDVWYGPAVERQRPEPREQQYQDENRSVRRIVRPRLDSEAKLVHIDYRLIADGGDGRPLVTEETHSMRYFFRSEIERFLSDADLTLESMTAFPSLDSGLDDSTWNALVVARKRRQ